MNFLLVLSVLGQVFLLVLHGARRRVPRLPDRVPHDGPAPHVLLIKPVLHDDARTLDRLRGWLRSAERHPGRSGVIFTTAEETAPGLRDLAREFPGLEIRVVSVTHEARFREAGLDKSHRLIAAEALVRELAPDGSALLVVTDEDLTPTDARAVERLAAAASRPGTIVALTIPRLSVDGRLRGWRRLQDLHYRSLSQVLALAASWLGRVQGMVSGYCMVIWVADLERLGGWKEVVSHLGEDVAIAVRATRAGIETRLFDPEGVLLTDDPDRRPSAFLRQLQRWAALRHSCRLLLRVAMLGGLPLKLATVSGTLALVLSQDAASALVFASAFVVSGLVLARSPRDLPLLPLEELLTVAIHLWGTFSRWIRFAPWLYRIDRKGIIVEKRWQDP